MSEKNSSGWKRSYTWVLLSNMLYILIFYFLMQIYS